MIAYLSIGSLGHTVTYLIVGVTGGWGWHFWRRRVAGGSFCSTAYRAHYRMSFCLSRCHLTAGSVLSWGRGNFMFWAYCSESLLRHVFIQSRTQVVTAIMKNPSNFQINGSCNASYTFHPTWWQAFRTAQAQSLPEYAITIFGPRLYNSLPKYPRVIESVETEKFKLELDKFLEFINDEPKMPNYVTAVRSNTASNTIYWYIKKRGLVHLHSLELSLSGRECL